MRVLVVEDDLQLQGQVAEALQTQGYVVDTAADGEHAHYIATVENYDLVVLDPPALIQKRRDFEQGRQAYFILNEGAIQRVTEGGLFVSASCSLHLERDELIRIVQQVARRQNKHVQLVHEAHPAADHPRLIPMTESNYLKCLVFRVSSL